jgi:colicin import membrane protein
MNSSGLWRDIKSNPLILIGVIAFHLVLVVLLSMNLTSSEVPEVSAPTKKTVKAVVVDASKVEAEVKKLKQAEEKKKQQALAQQKKIKKEANKARKQLEAEKKRLAALKKKQADEKKRLAALKKKKAAEQKKKADAEKKRIQAEKQKKEAEKKRLAALEEKRRQEEAAELKRRLEDEERREAEARQQAEHNRMLDSLRAQYVKLIEQKVERNWLRPVTSTKDMSCEVIVTQTSLGDVMSVGLQRCTNDLAFQRSIERAVRKASPLPPPPNPEVFDREIHFTFRPGS